MVITEAEDSDSFDPSSILGGSIFLFEFIPLINEIFWESIY